MITEHSTAIVDSIRESSRGGLLLSEQDILASIMPPQIESDGQIREAEAKNRLDEIIRLHEDIHVIFDRRDCGYYYSDLTLTYAYARLLVLKKENVLDLMVAITREHAATYARPVPITVFQHAPFELSQDEIACCTDKMYERQGYEDMDQITTSIGTRFLYSKRYLDVDHAMMLAEWEDVGQSANP